MTEKERVDLHFDFVRLRNRRGIWRRLKKHRRKIIPFWIQLLPPVRFSYYAASL